MMYRTEKLSLDHRNLIHNKLMKLSLPVSEYTFSSLYLFRIKHDYRVLFDKEIFIKGKTYDGEDYLMPVFDLTKADRDYIRFMTGEFSMIFPVPEEWLAFLDPEIYSYRTNENDSDYIHAISKMGSFRGKHLHGQKNLLYRFMNSYAHEEFPLTMERIPDAEIILESWIKESANDPESTDYMECMEAIKLYETLNLCGGIFYAEGEPAGFIIGEELNCDTFVIHFAKAVKKFKGIYQFMYNRFAAIMPSKYCCFNFEQDLGIEPLRNSKMSYKPEMMVKKYRVSLKHEIQRNPQP